jgi:hypothetical protein
MLSHVHRFGALCLLVSFKIPKYVELSIQSGAAGCLCPNATIVVRSGMLCWTLTNAAPASDSDAEVTIFCYDGSCVEFISVDYVFLWRFVAVI